MTVAPHQSTVWSRITGINSEFLKNAVLKQGLMIGYLNFLRLLAGRSYVSLETSYHSVFTPRVALEIWGVMCLVELGLLVGQLYYKQRYIQRPSHYKGLYYLWWALVMMYRIPFLQEWWTGMGLPLLVNVNHPVVSCLLRELHLISYLILPDLLTYCIIRLGETIFPPYILQEAQRWGQSPLTIQTRINAARTMIAGLTTTICMVINFLICPIHSLDVFRITAKIALSEYCKPLMISAWMGWYPQLARVPWDSLWEIGMVTTLILSWIQFFERHEREYQRRQQIKLQITRADPHTKIPGQYLFKTLYWAWGAGKATLTALAYVSLSYGLPAVLTLLVDSLSSSAILQRRSRQDWWGRWQRAPASSITFRDRGMALHRTILEALLIMGWPLVSSALYSTLRWGGLGQYQIVWSLANGYFVILAGCVHACTARGYGVDLLEDGSRLAKQILRFNYTNQMVKEPLDASLRELYQVTDPLLMLLSRRMVTMMAGVGSPHLWSAIRVLLLGWIGLFQGYCIHTRGITQGRAPKITSANLARQVAGSCSIIKSPTYNGQHGKES